MVMQDEREFKVQIREIKLSDLMEFKASVRSFYLVMRQTEINTDASL